MPKKTKCDNIPSKDTESEDITLRITNLETHFSKELDTFKGLMHNLKTGGSHTGTNIEQLINSFGKFEEHILVELESLKSQVSEKFNHLDSNVDVSLQHAHKNKLLIYGINEKAKEDLLNVVINLFNDKFNKQIDKKDLADCYRLGKKVKDKNRPVVVEFLRLWERNEIFYDKATLKGSRMVIAELLTAQRYKLYREVRSKFQNNCWSKNGVIVFIKDNKKYFVSSHAEYVKIVA